MWQRLSLELTFNKITMRLILLSTSALQRVSVEPKLSGPKRELRKLDDHMELFILGLILDK